MVFKISIEKRIAGAEAVGARKTSMLQDVEQGRPLELEALVGSVVELGRITGVPTPSIAAVHHVAALLSRTLAARGTGLTARRLVPDTGQRRCREDGRSVIWKLKKNVKWPDGQPLHGRRRRLHLGVRDRPGGRNEPRASTRA